LAGNNILVPDSDPLAKDFSNFLEFKGLLTNQ